MSRLWLLAAIVALAVPGAAAGQNPVRVRQRRARLRGRGSAEPASGRASRKSEQGSADPHRSGNARGARQGQDGDLLRQRPGGSGRHHDALRSLGGVFSSRGGAGAATSARRLRPVPRQKARPTPNARSGKAIRRIEARGGVTVASPKIKTRAVNSGCLTI